MVDKTIIDEWVKKAEEDFGFASDALDEELRYFPQICFHFHQATEKMLKAFIIANEIEFRKVHDLVVLLDACIATDELLKALKEPCKFLNAYYIDTRYPVHWPTNYTKDEALKAQSAASKVFRVISEKLSQ